MLNVVQSLFVIGLLVFSLVNLVRIVIEIANGKVSKGKRVNQDQPVEAIDAGQEAQGLMGCTRELCGSDFYGDLGGGCDVTII